MTATNRSEKETQILECALKLLIETGHSGLTMRGIADCAGMRLSNVQYYFKSRDDILIAMVAQYFDACAEDLRRMTEDSKAETQRDRIRFLVQAGLSHGHQISDMCRAFREIWAISSRNESVAQSLMHYYGRLADVIAEYVFQDDPGGDARETLKALLIPYFEGYSVTAGSLGLGHETIADMLTNIVLRFTSVGTNDNAGFTPKGLDTSA